MSKKEKIVDWLIVSTFYGCGCVAGYSICHHLPVYVPILGTLIVLILDVVIVWRHNDE